MASSGNVNISEIPITVAQINSIVFTLMPEDVKRKLPNSPEVSFVHTHEFGEFDFNIKKSTAGFNVAVTLVNASAPQSTPPASASLSLDSGVSEPESSVSVPDNEISNTLPSEPTDPGEVAENPSAASESMDPDVEINSDDKAASFDPEIERASADVPQTEIMPENKSEPNVLAQDFSGINISEANSPAVESVELNQRNSNAVPVTEVPAVETMPIISSDPKAQAKMDALFNKMAETGASDLHISVSVPPMVRRDGKMALLDPDEAAFTPETARELLSSIMPAKNLEEFARRNDTDFAYEIPGLARFRANIFMDRKGIGGVFRIIPSDIMTAEDLNLSKHILDLCQLSKGLVVVTGPTGSGKSTTLCAMVDYINRDREDHIITIEDPIEFTHENQKCLVNQREVHNHTSSFKDALRAALREDPDILLVGEMRDLETISIAIETAETGHLVFGTLHTTTAASTVDRIIDQFPADRQQQIRVMLSESLRGVIAQTLLPKIGGGRIAALEVLIVNPAISNLIREGKTFQIPSAMQTGKNKGMVMLNDSLIELCKKGIVEPKDAYIKAVDKPGFEALLERNGLKI